MAGLRLGQNGGSIALGGRPLADQKGVALVDAAAMQRGIRAQNDVMLGADENRIQNAGDKDGHARNQRQIDQKQRCKRQPHAENFA